VLNRVPAGWLEAGQRNVIAFLCDENRVVRVQPDQAR
jgi:hypothetical protein